MIFKNFISYKNISISVFIFVLLSILISCTSFVFAEDSLSPNSIELFTINTSDIVEDIYIRVDNNANLLTKTNNLNQELISNGDKLKGVTLQIQSKADSGSWKTHKAGDYDFIKPEDSISELKISDTTKINLDKHILYIKARYAWVTEKGSVYYDSWSNVAVIGKNSDTVAFPNEITESPEFSEVTFKFNDKEIPVVNTSFKNFPEIIASNVNNPTGSLMINVMISENGGEYRNVRFQPISSIESGKVLQSSILDKNNEYESGSISIKARYEWYQNGASYYGLTEPDVVSPWSEEITKEIELWSDASKWAIPYLNSAKDLNIFPSCLMGKNLTKNITRSEFASAAVKLYETMSGYTVTTPGSSPFSDCSEDDVLKAYSIGLINGIKPSKFAPDSYITREQTTVILTRLYKLINYKNWSLENDSEFKLEYDCPSKFSDDDIISNYAKESVYFMSYNKIIEGIGDNKFAPNNKLKEYATKNKGNATRQQTLILMLRMIEKFSIV